MTTHQQTFGDPKREHQDKVVEAALVLDAAQKRDPADPLWSARIEVERGLFDKAIAEYVDAWAVCRPADPEVRCGGADPKYPGEACPLPKGHDMWGAGCFDEVSG